MAAAARVMVIALAGVASCRSGAPKPGTDAGGMAGGGGGSDVRDAQTDTTEDHGAAPADTAGAPDLPALDGAPADAIAAAAAKPQKVGNRYRFASDGLVFEVDPQTGGRITTFSIDGKNVLAGPDASADNWGATFWPSPQSAWGWPPLAEIDSRAYAVKIEDADLVLSSGINQTHGVSVVKRFRYDAAARAVEVIYSLKNEKTSAASWAPWEVTRVAPGGLSFFLLGAVEAKPDSPPITEKTGAAWYQWNGAAISKSMKLFADGKGGWLAHVIPADRLLLVKTFPDLAANMHAPGEDEIEIYVDAGKKYVELEQQGNYGSLAAGASVMWTVRWYVRHLDAGVPIEIGAQELLDAVAAVIGK